jgi:hypothetical protein
MIILISILFISLQSFAFTQEELGKRFHFAVGLDLFQTQYDNERYKFDDYSVMRNPIQNAISRVAWNVSYRVIPEYPLYLGFRTNRGINHAVTDTAYDVIAKEFVKVRVQSTADSVYIATAVHRLVMPFVITTNLNSHSELSYNNGATFIKDSQASLYGFGIATPLGKRGMVSATYYLSNNKLQIKRMFGLSINYYII